MLKVLLSERRQPIRSVKKETSFDSFSGTAWRWPRSLAWRFLSSPTFFRESSHKKTEAAFEVVSTGVRSLPSERGANIWSLSVSDLDGQDKVLLHPLMFEAL